MRVLVSGSSGLVGRALCEKLDRSGHTVIHLVRPQSLDQRPANGGAVWDPLAGRFDAAKAEGADAVVHLAGASVAQRWNPTYKMVLRTSRVDATRHLVDTLAKLSRPPRVFIAASAVGYYGNRGDEVLTEQSPPASDFLGEMCQAWEAESARATGFGARVVHLRIGVVLARHGGALAKMLPPFRMGVGGVVGSGRQWMSWIVLDDLTSLIVVALEDRQLHGPINAVAPGSATNKEFTRALGRVLRRPTIFPLPAFVARIVFGEMADALLLASQRVQPARLQAMGYGFAYADLEPALRFVLR
jgi:hypothetical protein